MTKVINLFAGPGAGKSTTAAEVFARLKRTGVNVELVNEYAKDLTWEKRENVLTDQLYILAKQNRRVKRLIGQVDLVITDSPIIMSLAYLPQGYFGSFTDLACEIWESYDNHNFFIERGNRTYNPIGRTQSYEGAKELDNTVKYMLDRLNVLYKPVDTNDAASVIYDYVMAELC